MKELSFQAKGMRIFQSCVNKLTILIVYHIMIQNDLLILLSLHHLVRFVLHSYVVFHIAEGAEPYPDKAFLNEIHLVHFIRLVTYYLVFVYRKEPPWDQASRYVIEQEVIYAAKSAFLQYFHQIKRFVLFL